LVVPSSQFLTTKDAKKNVKATKGFESLLPSCLLSLFQELLDKSGEQHLQGETRAAVDVIRESKEKYGL